MLISEFGFKINNKVATKINHGMNLMKNSSLELIKANAPITEIDIATSYIGIRLFNAMVEKVFLYPISDPR